MLSRRRAPRHFEEFDDGGLAAWDEAAHPEHAAAARVAVAKPSQVSLPGSFT